MVSYFKMCGVRETSRSIGYLILLSFLVVVVVVLWLGSGGGRDDDNDNNNDKMKSGSDVSISLSTWVCSILLYYILVRSGR